MDGRSDSDNIVNMIDQKVMDGVGRIKVEVDEDALEGTVSERYHHGRCDVGSPFACGVVPNFDEDRP